MNSRYVIVGLATLLISSVASFFNANAESTAQGRISFADESALVRGEGDDEWSFAGINSLVLPGDTVWADEAGAVEIELPDGVFVRLADGSRLDVLEVAPDVLLRGDTGSFFVQRIRRSQGDVVFDTPVGAVNVEPDTQVRVDILEGGATTVSVRWGHVRIVGDADSPVRVEAGKRSYIDPGYLASEPVSFDRGYEDDFDSWNRERARTLALDSYDTPIQESGDTVPLGVQDLNAYGEWVSIDGDSYWRPTATADYVPYRRGSWSYVPAQGYVWVGEYPFSYVTTHYGYWNHHDDYGWIWSYGHHYRPAYAYTVHYGDSFIWAPLSTYGYPVYYGSSLGFSIGNVHFNYAWSSYAYDYDVYHGYHSVHAVYSHHIYGHGGHPLHDTHSYWRIDPHDSRYGEIGRPHWPGDRADTFRPQRVIRGATVSSRGGRRAGDRVNVLEARNPRGNTPRMPSATRTLRTPSSDRIRQASVRNTRIEHSDRGRVARVRDRSRNPVINRTRSDVSRRTRTITNSDARRADPLNRGNVPLARPSTPRGSTDRIRPNRTGRTTVSGRADRTQPRTRADRPNVRTTVPRRANRTQPRTRTDRPSVRTTIPNRVDRTQPRTRANRPTVPSRPRAMTQSTRPRVSPRAQRPSVNPPSVTRPRTTRSRPSVTSAPRQPRVYAPSNRPSASPRMTRPAPSARRPQVNRAPAVRRSSPSAGVSRPAAPRGGSGHVVSPPSRGPSSRGASTSHAPSARGGHSTPSSRGGGGGVSRGSGRHR